MNKISYKPLKEKVETDEILDLVFKDSSVKHGLQEFSKEILKGINGFEKEDGKFYVRCLKRDKDIFIYDKNKKTGKPEEVIRQLWLIKLTKEYKYPLDRIEVEKSVQFGLEVREKSADVVLYKEDKITPISRPYYLLRRISQASVRQNTDLPTIKDLKVPILPKPTQDKIADLVYQSHQARKKAKELLDRAKREVEEFIEKK